MMLNIGTRLLMALALCFLSLQAIHAQDFYGKGIQEIRVEIPDSDWDVKLDSLKKNNPEARLNGSTLVNGKRYSDVGIRYKGNSSYFRTRNETYKKLPFNIKINYKNKTQLLKDGTSAIKLSNAFLDPSFVRDPLTYEIVRQYMPASQCNFAKLYVNNKYYGLYINTESVDETFIKKHFGTNTGHLVKCDPDNWQRVRSQSGCPKGENASLMYLNDSPGCYDAFYEVDDVAAWAPMLNLIKTLNKNPKDIETVLDVDQTLWMLALNNTLVNLDSYNGSLSHNYYLWIDSTGVAHPIIWDLNMSFGGWRRNFSFAEMTDQELIQMQPLAEINNPRRPLISQLLKDPFNRKIYLAHYKTIVKEQLENGHYAQRAEELMKDIDEAVRLDSLKLYSYDNFKNSLDKTMTNGPDHVIGIRQLMQARTEWLIKHPLLNKAQPVLSSPSQQKKGAQWLLTVRADNVDQVRAYYRSNKSTGFKWVLLADNGENGDALAADGIYSALVDISTPTLQYYFAASNADAGATLPERASNEYFEGKK